MTERKRAAALGAALKAMFRKLEQRNTPEGLRAIVDQLEAGGERRCGEEASQACPEEKRPPKAGLR